MTRNPRPHRDISTMGAQKFRHGRTQIIELRHCVEQRRLPARTTCVHVSTIRQQQPGRFQIQILRRHMEQRTARQCQHTPTGGPEIKSGVMAVNNRQVVTQPEPAPEQIQHRGLVVLRGSPRRQQDVDAPC